MEVREGSKMEAEVNSSALARVIAVSVTYHPDPAEIRRLIAAVSPQVASVVVVDNGSPGDVSALLADTGCSVLSLKENEGIAAALNTGIRWARVRGATHVLLLDQDSEPAEDMVARLLESERQCLGGGYRAAAIGPRYVDRRRDIPPPFIRIRGLRLHRLRCPSGAPLLVDYLISSGSLIRVTTLDAVGDMDESLFIDYVDIEWGLRAKAKGYQSFGVCEALMYHSLGDEPIRLGRWHFPHHSPLRHYYAFRNATRLYLRSGIPWMWKVVDGYRSIFRFVFYGVFAPQPLQHIRMMLLGLWHGLIGRGGRLDLR